jgi:hypothetical protein
MERTGIALFWVVALGLVGGCASVPKPSRAVVTGEVGGDPVSSTVDSSIARYFLEHYLHGKKTDPHFDSLIDSILRETEGKPITNTEMKSIADRTSIDFGALIFAYLQTERHPEIKRIFLQDYELAKEGQLDLHAAASRYKVALVPGLFYQSKPHTKGDLREVRATLEEAGFEVVSIPILEAGSVEQNAKIIADFIKNEPVTQKKIALVSTSKGGPDTIYALGHLLSPVDTKKIAIWFSIGGAIRGSYLADHWTQPPQRWLASVVGVFAGFSIDMVDSLSVRDSRKRMELIRVPPHICVVHFVGVPLSGTVIPEVREGFGDLCRYGPNDGVTLLSDEIIEGSTVITALGLDHWYRDPDLKRKILALVSTVTRMAEPCRDDEEKTTVTRNRNRGQNQ